MGYISINKDMLYAKIAVFFVNAKDGVFMPYLTVFLISIGLNPEEAGMVGAAGLGGAAVGGILLSILADRTRCYTVIMLVANAFAVGSMVAQPWIAHIIYQQMHNSTNANEIPARRIFNETIVTSKTNGAIDTGEDGHQTKKFFYIIIAIFTSMRFFDGPNTGFCFGTVASNVNQQTDGSTVGRQLLFGGIGMGISAAVTGVLIDQLRFEGLSKYSIIFFLYPVMITCYLSSTLVLHGRVQVSTEEKESKSSVWDSFKEVANFHILFVILTCFVLGLSMNMVFGFLSLLLEDMNSSGTVMGLCILTSSGLSVITMEFASKIIDILGGPINTLGVACFSYCLRLGGFCLMTASWQAPIIDTFHVIGYGLFLPSIIKYIDDVTPSNIANSMQTLLAAVHFQVGGMVANLVGGVVYKQYGGRLLFGGGAVLAGIWTILIFFYVCYNKKKPRNTYEVL